MKKILIFILGITILASCTSNKVRPFENGRENDTSKENTFGPSTSQEFIQTRYDQKFAKVDIIARRADRSAIWVEIQNHFDKPITIDWEKTTLNGGVVTDDININGLRKMEPTVLKENEKIQKILYRKDSVYYLDSMLYVPGGLRVKPLDFPVKLSISIDGINNEMTIHD